jgi:hypothetical protein
VLLVASIALYFYDYESPAGLPRLSEALVRPLHAFVYLIGFLGSAFSVRAGPDIVAGVTAGVAGLLVLAAFIAVCGYVWRCRADRGLVERTSGWIALGAYSLGTGVLVAIGRLGFGVGQSLASRYTTFSLYLSVALVFLATIVLRDLTARGTLAARRIAASRAVLATGGALVAVQIPVFILGFRAMEDRSDELLRGKACLHLINVAPDRACLIENVYPNVGLLRLRANLLNERGFLRPPLATSRRTGG